MKGFLFLKTRLMMGTTAIKGIDLSSEGTEFLLQSPPACAKAPADELNLWPESKRCIQTGLALRNLSEGGSPDWSRRKISLCDLRASVVKSGVERGEY